ncbi:MAG: hypothetical protein I3J02_08805 [Prevotella sp.]|nr:hypothetical protein [Prevotella sp.]
MSVSATSMLAQTNTLADGYYRVLNTTTSRYACLYDNKGKVVKEATDVDAAGIRTYYGFSRVVSDPASVIYFKKSSSGYSLSSQGTDTNKMLGNYYLQLSYNGVSYQAYGQDSGYTIYLSDQRYYNDTNATGDVSKFDARKDSMGYMATGGAKYKYWKIIPVSSATDNYFGFSPTLQLGSDYYQSFYAEFPFSFASTGLKAYYVDSRSDYYAIARLAEITTTEIPGKTPMIIKSASTDPSQNRIDLLESSSAAVSGNLLTGVYFCSSDNLLEWYDQLAGNHENYVLNDSSTMRVLGIDNGALVLKKVSWTYIPRNSFYMTVPVGSSDVYQLLLPESYATGIRSVAATQKSSSEVYSVSGQLVSAEGIDGLPAGIYIQNGKKIVVK